MGVDHGGFDALVAQQFLNGAEVVAVLQEVGGKGVAERVAANNLVDASSANGCFDRFLEAAFTDMVATNETAARVLRQFVAGK